MGIQESQPPERVGQTETEPVPGWRDIIKPAAYRWHQELLDLTGRNPLLYCKEKSYVNLDTASEEGRQRLLLGEETRLSQLFTVPEDRELNLTLLSRIRERMRYYEEEKGVRVGRLASVFVSWDGTQQRSGKLPNAPLLLSYFRILPSRMAADDLVLRLEPEYEINEVLVEFLRQEFRVRIPSTELLEALDNNPSDFFPSSEVSALFQRAARDIPGLSVRSHLVAGTFPYTKLPMVKDLGDSEWLKDSVLVAALAGDSSAVDTIREPIRNIARTEPDHLPPEDEYLVLDADPSQNYAINAALAGRNIVIQGPPGTGKSQTIANLIVSCAAHGRSVLFVAEKRAAIDAVLRRLAQVGLETLVLDLHDGAGRRSHIYEEIQSTLANAQRVPAPDVLTVHHQLTASREALKSHTQGMHQPREPWNVSLFDAQSMALDVSDFLQTDLRFHPAVLNSMDRGTVERLDVEIREAASLKTFRSAVEQGVWGTATDLLEDEVSNRFAVIQSGRDATKRAIHLLESLRTALAFEQPGDLGAWTLWLSWLARVRHLEAMWLDDIWTQDLDVLRRPLAPRAIQSANGWTVTFKDRRIALRRVKALRRGQRMSRRHAYAMLSEIQTLRDEWDQRHMRHLPPRVPDLTECFGAVAHLSQQIESCSWALHRGDLRSLPLEDLERLLTEASKSPQEINRKARSNAVRRHLEIAIPDVLRTIDALSPSWNPVDDAHNASGVLRWSWAMSVVETIGLTDSDRGIFDGEQHSVVARDFVQSEHSHIASTPARVKRIHAERLVATRSAHPVADRSLGIELGRRRKMKPVREIVELAPEIILAAKPCWAMSPLVVSQVLPRKSLFDVVIFDEASQVRPAEAIPCLGRARQAVVCGDSKQLPPTSFFDGSTDFIEDEQDVIDDFEPLPILDDTESGDTKAAPVRDPALSLTEGTESILDVFNAALGDTLAHEYRLTWHYRSQDARLIAFSNAYFYDNSLITFPGTETTAPLSLVPAGQEVGQLHLMSAESDSVVDLILRHAAMSPESSLGVITMSLKHAREIQHKLDTRLRNDKSLMTNSFFNEGHDEPFFIKNLERVQGDERDSIIVAIGYAKAPDGRMRYNFGPINQAGGERRLNVAFTRARTSLTVVSSFTAEDMDPSRCISDGSKVLRSYLAYVASGGTNFGDRGTTSRPLNGFERHLLERLQAAGIPVIPQYGVAGYFLDFAAQHPVQPGKMVLAIEADGATYHSSETARARDRLRQEHIERLGWTFHRIWSTDYFRNSQFEIARAKAAYDAAVIASDSAQTPKEESMAPVTQSHDTWRLTEPRTRGPFPVTRGLPITAYSNMDLCKVVQWIQSDSLLRTDDEIITEASRELGFQRRGTRIVDRLQQALKQVRSINSV